MAESLISSLIDQLVSILGEQAAGEFKLVTGVKQEVKKLTNNLHAIQAVIEDAERRQVQEYSVKKWLHDLKDVSYDIDDLLDEWNTAVLKQKMEQEAEASDGDGFRPSKKIRYVINNLYSRFFSQRDIASKIGGLNERLDAIAHQRSRYNFKSGKGNNEQRIVTTSVINESEVFAREEDERKIKEMLLCDGSAETSNLCIISIVGMGGIGKTTLARLAYNDAQVKSQFDVRIWVCVSDLFEEERIAIEILESLIGQKPNLVGRDNILQDISKRVFGKKILLALDDVWTEDSRNWEQLKGCLKTCSPGSRILATTRKRTVAKIMGCRTMDMFSLGQLSEEKCWSLFCHLAFSERTRKDCMNLEDIGRKIVGRCKGLPLAVKVVGGLLRFRETKKQWQCILDSEMWEIEEVEKGVFPPLLLSYYDLPPVLRQCFSYCAIFPKDHEIHKEKLIKLWMAQGFLKETRHKNMDVVGEEYFNKLTMLSLIQDSQIFGVHMSHCYKMHDIVHDFAQFLTTKEFLLMEMDGMESWGKPSFETIRHLTINRRNETVVGISMEDWKKLRTLFIKTGGELLGTLSINTSGDLERIWDSIDHLTCLRALDLSKSRCRMLTGKIEKLTGLRYLDLSYNSHLKFLPEAVCDLCNLQSIDISACTNLKELPRGMDKLINLVHLENGSTFSLRFMPKGMERLTRLRTLREFVVRSGSGGGSCSLEGLGKLTHLQGRLLIKGLGNIAKSSEAKEAQLWGKVGLRWLVLSFDCDIPEAQLKQIRIEDELVLLEALQPPSCLESLSLLKLKGPSLLPNWMMSLTMLKLVTLYSCYNWRNLPPLGKLQFLEHLIICGMDKVKIVGEEFLGIEREKSSPSYISNTNYISFPKLYKIQFYNMPNWEEWEYEKLSTSSEEAASSSCFTIMPCLQDLVIVECPLLKILPHHILHNPTIQLSEYNGKPMSKQRFRKGENLPHCQST